MSNCLWASVTVASVSQNVIIVVASCCKLLLPLLLLLMLMPLLVFLYKLVLFEQKLCAQGKEISMGSSACTCVLSVKREMGMVRRRGRRER